MHIDPKVPFVREWDGFDHHRFIRWAMAVFEDRSVGHFDYSQFWWETYDQFKAREWAVKRKQVEKLYRRGKLLCCLDGDLESFCRKLIPTGSWKGTPGTYRYRFRYTAWKVQWYADRGVGFRQKLPKGIPYDRMEKGESTPDGNDFFAESMRSDKRREKAKRRCWKRGCPRFFKKESSSLRRADWRKRLHDEDWDNALTERRRDFIDPWRWD